MPDILVDRNDGLVTVTLNRPDRLNAVTWEMWRDMSRIFHEIAQNGADRVVVVRGAGEAFCSGADLVSEDEQRHALHGMREVANAAIELHRLPKPTIARVDGVAVGAGFNLALGCDLIAASDRSRFSQIFARRALTVDFGGSWLLPRLIGLHKAKEMVLLAGMYSAEETAAMGLLNRVVPVDELDKVVDGWVETLLAGPPLALSMSKALLNKSFESSMDQALEAESQAQSVNISGPDTREALKAFMEKRAPIYGPR